MTVTPRGPWLQAGARLAVVGGVAAALVLGSAGADPTPTGTGQVATAPDDVAASSSTTYCPGDPFAGGGRAAPQGDVTGRVTALAAPAQVLRGVVSPSQETGDLRVEELRAKASTAAASPSGDSPVRARSKGLTERANVVRGTGSRAPGLLATQSFVASGKDLQGLAALPCTAPTADAWLVAGGGEKGRQERLVLVNPGGNALTVVLEVVGAPDTGADRSVVVPARGRSVVLLDALGGTETAQAVHVSASGGLVVPSLVDSHLDGLTPAGVETVGPTAAPSKRLVLPGNADGRARGIVLAAPGRSAAVVEVRTLGRGKPSSAKVATVPAGGTLALDLPAADGVHSWLVESDEPVVAAAHTTTQDSKGRRDMAWSVASPVIDELGGVALPTSSDSTVRPVVDVVASEGPARVELLVLRDGKVSTRRLELAKERSAAVPVGAADAVWVRPTRGRVHAAALLIGRESGKDAAATSIPVLPSRVAVRDLPVLRER